jgi:hypothetical protein
MHRRQLEQDGFTRVADVLPTEFADNLLKVLKDVSPIDCADPATWYDCRKAIRASSLHTTVNVSGTFDSTHDCIKCSVKCGIHRFCGSPWIALGLFRHCDLQTLTDVRSIGTSTPEGMLRIKQSCI